eukprot:6198991-Pleurochrysis_carterae.AAC.2
MTVEIDVLSAMTRPLILVIAREQAYRHIPRRKVRMRVPPMGCCSTLGIRTDWTQELRESTSRSSVSQEREGASCRHITTPA